MTSGAIGLDLAEVSKSNAPQLLDVPAAPGVINEKNEKTLVIDDQAIPLFDGSLTGPDGEEYPTAEEIDTLRRICGTVPWSAYTVAFVELCERFSYYGTTAVCKFPYTDSDLILSSRGAPKADREPKSSTSFRTLFQMDQPPVNLVPTDNRVPWVWASEHRQV